MEDWNAWTILSKPVTVMIQRIADCNAMSQKFGLVLSNQQIRNLLEHRLVALQNAGRVEFGDGVLKKLITAFCSSPYLSQNNYEETLFSLQEMFYYYKTESLEHLSDDALITAMQTVFNGARQGSVEYLAGTSLEAICRFFTWRGSLCGK